MPMLSRAAAPKAASIGVPRTGLAGERSRVSETHSAGEALALRGVFPPLRQAPLVPSAPSPYAPTRSAVETGTKLHEGRFANATLSLVEHGGARWVVKDFAPSPFWIRWTVGCFFTRRELCALRRCQGIDGIPADPVRVDALALAYRHIEGRMLKASPIGAVGAPFFLALEDLVRQVHARRVVHLDLRNRRNVLVREDGKPAILDFQSAISTRFLPGPIRRLLEGSDLSGVYKHWMRYAPETLGEERRLFAARAEKARGLWIFRGYLGIKPRRRPPHRAQSTAGR